MSVRRSLLAILDQGACYGYQLRSEYERRTGGAALNVGQIYTTLERLERDGLVVRGDADERGHVYWTITPAGHAEVSEWFARPESREARDDLVHKIALAATLPGVDALTAVALQQEEAVGRRDRWRDIEEALAPDGDPRERILAAAAHARACADLAWLDAAHGVLADRATALPFAVSYERPRRGRPLRDKSLSDQAG